MLPFLLVAGRRDGGKDGAETGLAIVDYFLQLGMPLPIGPKLSSQWVKSLNRTLRHGQITDDGGK